MKWQKMLKYQILTTHKPYLSSKLWFKLQYWPIFASFVHLRPLELTWNILKTIFQSTWINFQSNCNRFHSTCVEFESTCVRIKATCVRYICKSSFVSNASRFSSKLVDFGKSCLTNGKFFDTARHVFITYHANASSFVSTTSCLNSNASRLIIAEVDWKLMQVDCKMVFKLFYVSSMGHKFTKEAKMVQYWGFHYNFDEKNGWLDAEIWYSNTFCHLMIIKSYLRYLR